jgi:tetratricopeptide (TPR) repeat protein
MSQVHRLGKTAIAWGRNLAHVLLCLSAMGCAGYQKKADKAFLIGDYESAALNYDLAIKDADEPGDIVAMQGRLAESKKRAAAAHLAHARARVATSDFHGALAHAQKASEYDPTPETQVLLADLRLREGTRLLQEGRLAHGAQRWDDAVRMLSVAQQLTPTEEGARLLFEATSAAERLHHSEFVALVESAHQKLAARDWSGASSGYQAAHQHGSTSESQRAHKFADLMLRGDGESRSASQSPFAAFSAVSTYRQALELGLDADHVQDRLKRVERATYRLTIHAAVVLPFKADSGKPWDGFRGREPDVAGTVKMLARFVVTGGVDVVGLGLEVTKWMNLGFEAPDCYVLVSIGSQTFGGKTNTDHDDLRPNWNLSIDLPNTNGMDDRVVNIQVRDADEFDDDNVGSVQIRLGELVMGGTQVVPFLSKEGELGASGLLALQVSTQRL